MSDDCLFLKVLVPANRRPIATYPGQATDNLMPIILAFPGGGFTGANNEYDMRQQADVFVSKGVIAM